MLPESLVRKYRPTSIDDYIFTDPQTKDKIKNYIENRNIPHLIFAGHHGTGKTALVNVLVNELQLDPSDVKKINSSDEKIDVFRNEIKDFVESVSFSDFKVVFLDEADGLSRQAQELLRGFVDEHGENARFIMTCNYPHKLIEPLRDSRFRLYEFNALDKVQAAKHVAEILDKENIDYDMETLAEYVEQKYPDLRAILENVEDNSFTGTLTKYKPASETSDLYNSLLDYVKNGDWKSARKLLCENVSDSDWEDVYRFLYQNIDYVSSWDEKQKEKAITTIAEYLFKHGFMRSCPELNAAALMIELSMIGE